MFKIIRGLNNQRTKRKSEGNREGDSFGGIAVGRVDEFLGAHESRRNHWGFSERAKQLGKAGLNDWRFAKEIARGENRLGKTVEQKQVDLHGEIRWRTQVLWDEPSA